MQNFYLQKYLGNNPLLEDENSNSEDFFNSLTEEQLQEATAWGSSQEVNYTLTKEHLKKIIKEGLSEDESKAVLDKYKQRYAAVLKSNPDFIKKYPNPDKVIYGMAIKEITKLREKLSKSADVGDYIDDFRKSNAKQFQGKSEKKRNQMATAAFLNKEEQKLDEIDAMMEFKKRLSPEALELYADDIEPLKKQGKSDKEIAKMLVPDNPDAILTQFKLVGEDELKETGQEIAKKNMDDYKRLNELVKAALMGPISEKKQRPDYPDVDGDGDTKEPMVKALKDKEKSKDGKVNEIKKRDELQQDLAKGKRDTIKDSTGYLIDLILDFMKDNPSVSPQQVSSQFKKLLEPDEIKGYLETTKTNESFKSLSKDIDKQKGKTKEDGDNIAGYIANIKREGGGKGPTAKQKKRMAETIFKELREGKSIPLTPEEQEIVTDITESLNEGILDFDKIKQYAKKGLMTAAILLSLNATGFSAEQQQKISDIVKTEMPASKKGEVDRIYKVSVVIDALKKYQKGKKKGKGLENLSSELEQSLITLEKGHNVDDVVKVFNNHGNDLDKFISWR